MMETTVTFPLPESVIQRGMPKITEEWIGFFGGKSVRVVVPVTVRDAGINLDFHFKVTGTHISIVFGIAHPSKDEDFVVWDIRYLKDLTREKLVDLIMKDVFASRTW